MQSLLDFEENSDSGSFEGEETESDDEEGANYDDDGLPKGISDSHEETKIQLKPQNKKKKRKNPSSTLKKTNSNFNSKHISNASSVNSANTGSEESIYYR